MFLHFNNSMSVDVKMVKAGTRISISIHDTTHKTTLNIIINISIIEAENHCVDQKLSIPLDKTARTKCTVECIQSGMQSYTTWCGSTANITANLKLSLVC